MSYVENGVLMWIAVEFRFDKAICVKVFIDDGLDIIINKKK